MYMYLSGCYWNEYNTFCGRRSRNSVKGCFRNSNTSAMLINELKYFYDYAAKLILNICDL